MSAPLLTQRMTEAFDMAREVHNGGSIKGTDLPYLLHVLDVCSIALRHGADEDQAIAALLHDVVEDGGGAPRLEEIRERFGQRTADIVFGCSDSMEEDPNKKEPWWPRKIRYLDHLGEASTDVALVSAADKLSNSRSILADFAVQGAEFWPVFKTGRAGTLWYYMRVAEKLPPRLADTARAQLLGRRLEQAVSDIVEAVGPETAEADWQAASAEEHRIRSTMS